MLYEMFSEADSNSRKPHHPGHAAGPRTTQLTTIAATPIGAFSSLNWGDVLPLQDAVPEMSLLWRESER